MTVPTTSPHTRRGEQLFAKHHVALRRHVRRRDASLADDVVSETFAIAWRKLDDIPADREFPWLCVTADNVLRNQWRGQRRAHALTEALEWVTPGASGPAEPAVVGDAINGLPDRERALLTMTSFEGLSAVEAADRLGIAHGTARNALVNARRQLATRLAALGVVVASIVFAIVFVAGRPSQGEQARAQIVDELQRAEGVRQVATVVGEDGTRRTYELHTDVATGDQQVTLPDGRTARSTDGEELTVVPRRGESPKQTEQVQRRYAGDLSVLEIATPEQIEALLDTARRAGSAPAGPTIDGRETTVVRGTITDPAGRLREVELVIAVDEPEILRMRTRLDRPGAKWVTVDFSEWEAVSRKSLAATRKAPEPQRSDAAALTPTPLERVGGDTEVASIRDAGPSTPGGAAAAPGAEPENPPSSMPEEDTAPKLPTAYEGPTGRVLHAKTRAVLSGGVDGFTESWIELGGGERSRVVFNELGPGRKVVSTSTTWSTPDLTLHTFSGKNKTAPDLTVLCKPQTPTEVKEAKAIVEAVDAARAALARGETLPAGQPTGGFNPDGSPIPGQATVLFESPAFDGTTNIRQLSMVAETGQVVQKETVGPKVKTPSPPDFYETWEVLPAGGSAAALVETIPEQAQVIACEK